MNVVKRTGTAALAAIVIGCGAATEPDADVRVRLLTVPTEVVLRHGQEVRVQEGLLRLTFVQVLEDSRCPEDVTCVWEGNAKIQIGAGVGMGPSDPIDLNTAQEPRAVEWQGVRIILEEVLPSRQGDTPPKSEDYSIRLRLEPVE
jgi:hypothetical protein